MHSDSDYRIVALRQLRDQQVRFAPREKKIEQVDRTESLLGEIDSDRTYTYEYICYRITDFRPEVTPNVTINGADAAHDLRLMIEDLSDAADVSAEQAGEPVLTVDELAKSFNVSTKTISRWRQLGLVSRRFVFDGRKRVGFLKGSVDRFVAKNHTRVRRGAKFSQLTDTDRDEIISRARRLAAAGGCPAEVTRRIARRMNRSIETIRYTIRQFDQENPKIAIFPDRSGPLTDESKEKIYREYRRGIPAETLSKRFCRTKTSVYRIIGEMRAHRILELPLDCMHHESFEDASMEAEILGPMPMPEGKVRPSRVPPGLPPYLASLYDVPLLNREQEAHLFRKLNYLKFKADKLREKLTPARARTTLMDKIESLYEAAVRVKNQIVQANLRLVVSIAKRHVNASEDFFELVSDGNMSLIRAVEKFDFSRGNKFSTYASWAIMKNFARTIPENFKQRDRFRTSHDEMFSATEDDRTNQYLQESAQQRREQQIGRILSRLDEREQRIIINRFGLDHRQEPLTLKQVGAEMGVTKERVRQIEARALNKLRIAAQEEHLEIPEAE